MTAPAWTDATRLIKGKLEVNWDKGGVNWVDESPYITESPGVTWNYSSLMLWQMLGGTQQQNAWTLSAELHNTADRFSPTKPAPSALAAYIGTNKGHGIPMRFSMGIDNGVGGFTYTQVFAGVIDKLDVLSTLNDRVKMECLDNSHPLMQNRQTTTLYLDETAHSWLDVLAGATLGNVASTSFAPGLYNIPFCWLDDEQIWPEMNKVAHSEGGWVWFDQSGTLNFENIESWLTDARHTGIQYTFIASRFRDLAPKFNWTDTYNEVVCQYQPRAIKGRQEVWRLEAGDRRILPGETHTILARLRLPCVAVFTPIANTDYHIIDGKGEDMTGIAADDVHVTISAFAQRVTISVENNHASKAAYIFDFALRGIPVIGYPAGQVAAQASDADYGDYADGAKTLTLSGNEYSQTPDQAGLLAPMLRDRLKICRETYVITDYPGQPTLVPGDRVAVQETGAGIDNEGFILSIASSYSGGAYKFTSVEILDAASWFPYDDYFLLGTDLLDGDHKAFY